MLFQKQVEADQIHGKSDLQIIDVRTSTEYKQGSVLDSINIPLFDEEERGKIGVIYNRNTKAARFVAMDILAPKIPLLVRKIHHSSYDKLPVIVCWRGGMRSKTVVDLLQMAGIKAYQLHGGYKAYRQYIYYQLKNFQLDCPLIVLRGKSGTGKTKILEILAEQNQPILDLEGLAHHRGSTFGRTKHAPSTQKNFDRDFLLELQRLAGYPYILVEGESKRIGNVYLPDLFYSAMSSAPTIEVVGSMQKRVERLVQDYTPQTHLQRLNLYRSLHRLKHRLGKSSVLKLRQFLDNSDYASFARGILKVHYDKTYAHNLSGKMMATINSDDEKKAANEIAALAKHHYCCSGKRTYGET